MGYQLMAGGLGTIPPSLFAQKVLHEFQGRRWEWVDPAKDIAAKRAAYDLRITSISQIIRDAGRDPETVFAEIARDNERMAQAGISAPEVMDALAAAPAQTDDEDE